MEQHVKVLGVLYIALGILGALIGLLFLILLGGAAGIAGVAAQEEPEAWIAVPILGIVGTVLFVCVLMLSIPGIIAGWGLLKFRSWARILAMILSVLNLLNIPFGTVLGVYGLWVLLSRDVERLFDGAPGSAIAG